MIATCYHPKRFGIMYVYIYTCVVSSYQCKQKGLTFSCVHRGHGERDHRDIWTVFIAGNKINRK